MEVVMNKKFVASALMGLVLSAGMLAAQNQPTADKSSPEAARLTKVSVHRGKAGISVEITCSRPITPTPTMISDPSRLVLDFADTILAEPRNRTDVGEDGLKAVRLGVQPTAPPTTRVVLDLDQQRAYQLIADGNKLTVKLGDVVAMAPIDPQPERQVPSAPTATPASELSSPRAPEAATATTIPAVADSAAAPNADPSASAGVELKSAGQVATSQPSAAPVQIASTDPGAAVAASVAHTENTENAEQPPAGSKPPTQVSDSKLQFMASNSGNEQHRAPMGADASGLAKSEAESSPSTPLSAPVSTASTQSLSLAAAKVTPDLPDVTPPATPVPNPAPLTTPNEYVIGEQDVLSIVVWKERELSATVVVRPDGKITLPLVGEIKVVGMTPEQLQSLLAEKFKPFLNIPQVTVEVVQINSRKAYLIGEVGRTGTFPLNSSTTVLQIIAQAGGLRDFAKRKDIYILRNQQGHQVRFSFNYDEVIRGKNTRQNIVLQPGDMVVVP
jgi:polysaccharide export outer membrane protein